MHVHRLKNTYRGMLFAPDMARAVWEGRKTQTRRVCKVQPPPDSDDVFAWFYGDNTERPGSGEHFEKIAEQGLYAHTPSGLKFLSKCPYPPGSVVYVKENFCQSMAEGRFDFLPDGSPKWLYQASDPDTVACDEDGFQRYRKDGSAASPWTSKLHMPMWAARSWLRITEVRVQHVQEITEADAIAEGFDADTCAEVLSKAAGKQIPTYPAYVRFDDDTESQKHYCEDCAEKELAKANKPGRVVVESGSCPETDGPAYCEECRKPLLYSLTEYGIDCELFLDNDDGSNINNFAATGMDAAISAMIAGGIGDLRDGHLGRLAQIGFATCIDLINGAGTWKSNPWTWAYTFERVERPEGAQ